MYILYMIPYWRSLFGDKFQPSPSFYCHTCVWKAIWKSSSWLHLWWRQWRCQRVGWMVFQVEMDWNVFYFNVYVARPVNINIYIDISWFIIYYMFYSHKWEIFKAYICIYISYTVSIIYIYICIALDCWVWIYARIWSVFHTIHMLCCLQYGLACCTRGISDKLTYETLVDDIYIVSIGIYIFQLSFFWVPY